MLGLGWTEMLVIGVVALIFIGPKDLPVVMNKIGKLAGQIRRMGNEFQREINRTTGLDEVRNLRNSITEPLRKTSEEIRKEFNTMTATGPKPSGLIKPSDPKVESVVDEIKAKAGMTPAQPAAKTADEKAAEYGFKSSEADKPVKAAVAKKPAARKAPAKAKPAPTAPVTSADLPPAAAQAPVKAARAPAKPKAAPKPKASAKPDAAAAPAPAARKPRARKAAAKPEAGTAGKQ
ncbi:Sec-independent protein translocase protein TatB [Devosia sp.]|uniref:Sec-independent protein translocase protein TatB n=1 Tax=Devosia sp. TaxID=1871048 RepID=UPI002AFF97FC|nr:Sec-independent protein translocase protein TatB [Devosia sp.]